MDPHAKPPCCRVSLAEICSLYEKLFQTAADMRFVQAAVDKVCGTRPHRGFCCSSKLLDVLVEIERQRWVKEQLYWDFQLLDFDRDSSLSLNDVKILLQKAHESQVTSTSWVDFVTQRQNSSNRVTWTELEAWLFDASSLMRQGPLGASNVSMHENDQLQYQEQIMDKSRRLKNQWDTGGLEVIVRAADGTTDSGSYLLINQMDLKEAVNHKYAALSEKLFYDMLQAHYGSQTWSSMNNDQKQQSMNELKMLAEFGLERGSELVLSQLPGATLNFREEENSCSCKEAKKKWVALQGLKELQRRLEWERNDVTNYSDSICHAHQFLLLFAQKIKAKMECNFSAALLVVEPYWKQRFWDENPVNLETSFEELARIRLTTGQRMKQEVDKEQFVSIKMTAEEDKLLALLKRQKGARDLLFQLLQSCSHEELQEPQSNLLHNITEESMDLVKNVSVTKVERNPLRQLFILAMTVTKTCLLDDREMVTWGDCAVRLLVQVQLKQELELRELIQDLSRGVDNDDHSLPRTKEPAIEENDPVSYLIRLLQPITPKEQLNLEQLKAELVSSLECTQQYKGPDNKRSKKVFGNQEMTVKISKKDEYQSTPYIDGNSDTNVNQKSKDDLNDVRVKQPEEASIREKPQEKIHTRQTRMVSSMLKEHEKEQGHQCQLQSHRKEENWPMNALCKSSGKTISKQNEEYEQENQTNIQQVPSDELASSVMEATESLIAGLMTLKAKVEEAYMKKGTGRPSHPMPVESDPESKGMNIQRSKTMEKSSLTSTGESVQPTNADSPNITCYGGPLKEEDIAKREMLEERQSHRSKEIAEEAEHELLERKDQLQVPYGDRNDTHKIPGGESKCNILGDSLQISPENLSTSILDTAESLIVSLKALKEEISQSAKPQIIEHIGGPSTGEDSVGQKCAENAPGTLDINVAHLEGRKTPDTRLDAPADQGHGTMTREVSWELLPQCLQGCNHARLFDSEVMTQTDSSAVSGNTSSEDKIESLQVDFKSLDGKPTTALPILLSQRDDGPADTEYMSHTENKEKGCHQEDDPKVQLGDKVQSGENGSSKQEEDGGDMTVSSGDCSSENSSTDQVPADKLAMSFLEATHNLIGELIPGKEEAGLSSVRRVVVILTDSENGDLILGPEEDLSEESGTSGTREESPTVDTQAVLPTDEEGRNSCICMPANSPGGDSGEPPADCIPSGNHATILRNCPHGTESTKLMEIDRQSPVADTLDADLMTCSSQGCDGTENTQCQKEGQAEKENSSSELTFEKCISSDDCGAREENYPKLRSKIENVIVDKILLLDKETGANNDVEAIMVNKEQKIQNKDKKGEHQNTLNLGHICDSESTSIDVTTSERGNPLTQTEDGRDHTGMASREEEGAAEEHSKETKKDEETQTGVNKSKSVHSGDQEKMNEDTFTVQDYVICEDKTKETKNCIKLSQSDLCPYPGGSDTLVKSVLLSTEDLIGSLTSLKERLTKNDTIIGPVKTPLTSTKDDTNEQETAHIPEESCSQFCDFLRCKDLTESSPSMELNLSYVSVNSEDHTVQEEEDPSTRSGKMLDIMQQNDKKKVTINDSHNITVFQKSDKETTIDNRNYSMPEDETGFTKKESLSHSSNKSRGTKGMVILNNRHRDWKKTWRSVCERQIDKLRICHDGSKQKSSISKRIELQIIEKSKSKNVGHKQQLRPRSPPTADIFEMQEDVYLTSFSHEDTESSDHMDVIQEKEGDLVTQNKTTGTEQTHEQGSLKDLTISLVEATNSLIGRWASLKSGLGHSQGSDPCKIEQNVDHSNDQRFDVATKDTLSCETPASLMVDREDSRRTSDFITDEKSAITDKSTMKTEYCPTMKAASIESHLLQETSVDGECREGHRQQARSEEKVESSEMVFSITSNLAIIQNHNNQGELCHIKDRQLKLYAHSVETSHEIDTVETTEMQLKNKTEMLQEEMSSNAQVIKQPLTDSPARLESMVGIEKTMPEDTLSNTSYSLKVSHRQATNNSLAKWKSIVMHKIKLSSEHNMCEMHKTGRAIRESVTGENNDDSMNKDRLTQTENELNVEIHQESDRIKTEQLSSPEMKDLEMQTLRSYIKNGVIKRKRDDAEEREDVMQSNDLNLSEAGNTAGSEKADELLSFEESSLKVQVKYRNCEVDPKLEGSVNEKVLMDLEIDKKDINAEEKRCDSQIATEHTMKLNQLPIPYMTSAEEAGKHGMAINKQKQAPWLKFWEAANQTVAVAAVSTMQTSNFFGHMAQVPANGVLVRNEKQLSCPVHTFDNSQVKSSTLQSIPEASHATKNQAILQREKVFIRLSLREQQEAMQRLRNLQREAELKCASDRRRQMLRFQERLSIARNRKSELDLMDITQRRSPQLSPEPLAERDVERQKSVVKEHLEKVKRERTYIMQTRRDRNMTSFRELLDPVLTAKKKEEDSGS